MTPEAKQSLFNERYPAYAPNRKDVVTMENMAEVLPALAAVYTPEQLSAVQQEQLQTITPHMSMYREEQLLNFLNLQLAKIPGDAPDEAEPDVAEARVYITAAVALLTIKKTE
jgi:hypothetical protein